MKDLQSVSVGIITREQSPEGAYVACPSFGPYRYCWLRDGSFIAYSMDRAGQFESAHRFHLWVHSVIQRHRTRIDTIVDLVGRGLEPDPQGMMPARYCLDGSISSDGWPVFQIDGYGTWLWSLASHVGLSGQTSLIAKTRGSIEKVVEYLSACWRMPSYDCWEEHGDLVHPSSLACVYGGLTAISQYVNNAEIPLLAAEIKRYILSLGVADGRFVKSVGCPEVDASLLWLAVPFGVVAPDDQIMSATVVQIEQQLYHSGVHRYSGDTYYGGGEWPLLTAWLGWYYCLTGRADDAIRALEWVEQCMNDSGELPEQISAHPNAPEYHGVWHRRWGDIARPLLWSHAMHIVLADELAAIGAEGRG